MNFWEFVIPGLALLVSTIAMILSARTSQKQLKYEKKQNDLNELLYDKEQKEKIILNMADITAELIQIGISKEAIRVVNIGHARAENVDIDFSEEGNWTIMNEFFPMDMDPGQSVDLKTLLAGGSSSKQECLLSWNDSNGNHCKRIMLTS